MDMEPACDDVMQWELRGDAVAVSELAALKKYFMLCLPSGRRRWPICWCCLDRGPGSFDVEDATTLSWSSAAVSEWVCLRSLCCNGSIMLLPCPLSWVFPSPRKIAERIPVKFAGGSHCHQQITCWHFGRNWNRDRGENMRFISLHKSTSRMAWHLNPGPAWRPHSQCVL